MSQATTPSPLNLRKRALFTLSIFAVGAGLAVTALPLRLPEICLFKRITGLPCCGCGMTHAFCALSHGQVQAALNFNIASLPLALFLAITALLLTAELLHNRSYFRPFWAKTQPLVLYLAPPILLLAWTLNLIKHFHP